MIKASRDIRTAQNFVDTASGERGGAERLHRRSRAKRVTKDGPGDQALIRMFRSDPEGAYHELLERFTPAILRMIRRFMRESDDVMEVYTAICERLRAHDFRALIGFRPPAELLPWLSVVAANACRDRQRRQRATSVPESVLAKLTAFERLVFTHYYGRRLSHEEVAEVIGGNDGHPCTAHEVVCAIEKINDLLSVRKRWQLLAAMNANRPLLSVEGLQVAGIEVAVTAPSEGVDAEYGDKELAEQLHVALAELESDDRLLVQLRYEQGMKAAEIADVMGYDSHKYVYSRLRTVVGHLRRRLSDL